MTAGRSNVVQQGTVVITATDDTAAGVKAAASSVARGMEAIEKSAAKMAAAAAKKLSAGDAVKAGVAAAAAEEAKRAKAITDARVKALHGEVAALREQQKILHAIGGDAKQLHDLRMRELATMERAAVLAGKTGASARAAQTMERVRFAEQQEAARSKVFGEAGSGISQTSAATKTLADQLKSAAGPAASLASALGQVGMSAVGIGALGGTIGMVVQGIDKLSADSLKAQRVSAGLQFNIEGASKAFGGYVDNVSLAQSANKAYAMGVVKTGAEFERLAKGVNAIALQFGEDATVLLDNAVTAVGRQSRLILDNLGIILDVTRAEKIYAEALGVTTAQLTAYQKEIAFSEAAKILITKAGDEAAVSIDGFAAKVQKGKVALENYRQGILGFDTSIGKTREAIRALTDEEFEKLAYGAFAVTDGTDAVGRSFDKMLRNAGALEEYAATLRKPVDQLTASEIEQAKALKDTGVGLFEVKKLAQELGVTYDELIAMEEHRRKVEGDKQGKKEQDAQTRANIKRLRDHAAELEHEIELREVLGMTEADNLEISLRALAARKLAAKTEYDLTGEIEAQNEALRIQRQIELLQLKAETGKLGKKKGGGSGPTEADRVKAAGMATVQWMQAEVEYAEAIAAIRGTEKKDAGEIAQLRLQAADAALELEAEVLSVTRAKNSVERQNIQNRLDAIERERELLGLRYQAEERAAANELVAQAVAEQERLATLRLEQSRQEARAQANIIDLQQARLAREEQAIRTVGAQRQAAARHELESLDAVDAMEAGLHAVRLRQLQAEHDARARALDQREAEATAMVPTTAIEREQQLGELRQVEHERQLLRMSTELELARAKDAEEQRLADSQRARVLATISTVEQSIDAVGQLYSQASEFASFVGQQRAAEQDAALGRTVAALEARGRAEQAAAEREIKAAEGNATLQGDIRRRAARQQQAIQAKVEKAQADHAERQRKIEARGAGFKLLIDGAVNTAKAISAYASYNYVQGALYTAAAAFNFAQGGMLLAGNIPGAGGASMGGASMGAGGGAGIGERETSAASSTPGSVPGEAARRSTGNTLGAGQQSGGTVVNIQRIDVLGAIDEDSAEKIGEGLRRAGLTREGSA